MSSFINEDLLLENESARRLYHGFAEGLPLVDYHNHLDPAAIAADGRFSSMTEIWLGGDHYKWRAMRAWGVGEDLITGGAPDREKFRAWMGVLPHLLKNPLYHWSCLELARCFGLMEYPGRMESDGIYDRCNELLGTADFSALSLLRRSAVKLLCTTDDPVDSLEHHVSHAASGNAPAMLPAWRPDAAMNIEQGGDFNSWLDRLSEASGGEIVRFDDLLEALKKRHDFFHHCGCRVADHGLETFPAARPSTGAADDVFRRVRSGGSADPGEAEIFRAALLPELCAMNCERGWVQQFHFGIMRNINSGYSKRLGRDSGFDAIGDFCHGPALAAFLDSLERRGRLARTVLYPANPADHAMTITVAGAFQGGGLRGRMQTGSAWWFLDHISGIEEQLERLSSMGLLSVFIGMTTDSRSLLSFSRHEYFRRILCNILGRDMEKGIIPPDMALVGGMVEDICFGNAADYFGFSRLME